MSTVLTCRIDSTSSGATEKLGEQLGRNLKGGEVIELVSDLGGGKTTFVRGLARGIGSKDRVTSPTFTVSKVYESDKFELHHFDFYRLKDAGLMEHELHDLINDPAVVVVIEWGDVVNRVLPDERLTITISRTGEDERSIELIYSQKLAYLMESLC